MQSPHGPTKYLGPNVFYPATVTVNRRPTSTDIYQPTTGKYYLITSLWQVGKNPTTGVEGEVWLLTKIVANTAYWELITGGTTSGTVVGLADSSGDLVGPDGTGIINVIGDTNSIITTNVDGILPYTMRVNIKAGEKNASSAAGKAGAVSVNSAQFDIDANGWISLIGSTGPALTKLVPQTGTTPVVPTATGQITLNGTVVAAGTNPFRSNGTGANTFALQVQISQAIAATDATKIGLSNFDSTKFTVDANGFVSTLGTAIANTITGNDSVALSPTAGNWNIFGSSPVAGTNPVRTTGSGSTLTVNVQKSQAIAATDATKVGLSNFNSADFTVDANGFVSLLGGGPAVTEFQLDTGGNVSPSGGTVKIRGQDPASTNGIETYNIAADEIGIRMKTPFLGDFNFQSTSASDRTLMVENTSTGAAYMILQLANGTAQDALYRAIIAGGTRTWSWGINTSDNTSWVLSPNSSVNRSNSTIVSYATGPVNFPNTPSVRAVRSASATNATGDSTAVTLIWNTELVDQNSNYNNATGVFTAPKAGNYHVGFTIELGNLGVTHQKAVVNVNRSVGIGAVLNVNPYNMSSSDNLFNWSWSSIYDLAAGETVSFTVAVYGGTKTVSIDGNGTGINEVFFALAN